MCEMRSPSAIGLPSSRRAARVDSAGPARSVYDCVVLPDGAPLVSINDHIVEPADLWTSGVAQLMRAAMPHVDDDVWVIGPARLRVPLLSVMSADGTPGAARRVEDMHPAVFDPAARLVAMDTD